MNKKKNDTKAARLLLAAATALSAAGAFGGKEFFGEPIDLRMFGDLGAIVPGKKIIYLYRIHANAATESAQIMAYTTQNSRAVSAEAQTTVTKDGVVRTPGTPQVEITATALLAKGDPMIDTLTNAVKNGVLVECWEANLEEPVTGTTTKFKGTYYQGYITSISLTSNAEGNAEAAITFAANGAGADGDVTVTAEQQEQASYVFSDTTAGA